MTSLLFQEGLMHRLPPVRGKLTANASLHDNSWFRVGGPAEVLFKPADKQDLAAFLKDCPAGVPLTVLGAGSNILIRDGGISGVVIKLGPSFASIEQQGETLTVGAAAIDLNIARAAQKASLAGLEFLSGIPGTLGGALRMNAGAHDREIKDCVVSVTTLDRQGEVHILTAEQMGFTYRRSSLPPDWIFISATLHGTIGNPQVIEGRMQTIAKSRAAAQPIREKTCGSTFANPDGQKAWQLIERAGCRGLRIGGAMMAEQHCNFMINTGAATAADLEALGQEVQTRVKENSGIELRWEVRRIGVAAKAMESPPPRGEG